LFQSANEEEFLQYVNFFKNSNNIEHVINNYVIKKIFQIALHLYWRICQSDNRKTKGIVFNIPQGNNNITLLFKLELQ